jgi:antitoxin component of RelBE/YafQ-DinJ toxin-antitoxin module
MASAHPISFRLDDESAEALSVLQRDCGLDQSGAVRLALIEAAQRRRRASLAAEAETLAADPADRAEVAEIRALMDSLRATG